MPGGVMPKWAKKKGPISRARFLVVLVSGCACLEVFYVGLLGANCLGRNLQVLKLVGL